MLPLQLSTSPVLSLTPHVPVVPCGAVGIAGPDGYCAIARWVSVGTEEMVFVPLEDAVRTGGCFGVGAGKWGGGGSQLMAARGREGTPK